MQYRIFYMWGVMDKSQTACLTGYRPDKLPWGYDEEKDCCIKFKEDLKVVLEKSILYGLKKFLTGMAEGFDMIATEILLELRKKYDIKIIAVIPCIGQEKFWKDEQQKRYHTILKKCDKKIILNKKYTPICMNERNKFMVEYSSVVIACYCGHSGGTRNTLKLAKEYGCKIKIINPFNSNK